MPGAPGTDMVDASALFRLSLSLRAISATAWLQRRGRPAQPVGRCCSLVWGGDPYRRRARWLAEAVGVAVLGLHNVVVHRGSCRRLPTRR